MISTASASFAMQRWIGAAATQPRLAVYGPTGVAEVVAGFRAAYSLDQQYRTTHHGATLAPPGGFGAEAREFAVPDRRATSGPRRRARLRGSSSSRSRSITDRLTPAVGYRVRYKDRLVGLSGDTRRSDDVVHEAQGADLLIHEALSAKLLGLLARGFERHGRARYARYLMRDIQTDHSSPEEAATVAAAAKVRRLVLNHIVPPLPTTALNDEFSR
jgi:ribonuclease Z